MATGAEVLRQCRESRQLSQADVASALKVTDGAVSQWENGRTTPRRAMAIRLDDALGAGGEIVAAFGYAAELPNSAPVSPLDDDLREQVAALQRVVVAIGAAVELQMMDDIAALSPRVAAELRAALESVR